MNEPDTPTPQDMLLAHWGYMWQPEHRSKTQKTVLDPLMKLLRKVLEYPSPTRNDHTLLFKTVADKPAMLLLGRLPEQMGKLLGIHLEEFAAAEPSTWSVIYAEYFEILDRIRTFETPVSQDNPFELASALDDLHRDIHKRRFDALLIEIHSGKIDTPLQPR